MPSLNLPSPERTVKCGVRVARRLGLSESEALECIMLAAQRAYLSILSPERDAPTWLAEVSEAARRRLRERHGYT